MNEAERRIEAILKMEEDRPQRDGAGICIPINHDASIRARAFSECLQIIREEVILAEKIRTG